MAQGNNRLTQRAAEVYYAAKRAGATDIVAAALAGNAQQESEFKLLGDNTKNNRGIFNASDKMGLHHLNSLGAQVARFIANIKKNGGPLWNQMQSATSVGQVQSDMKATGSSGFGFGISGQRQQYGNNYLAQFGGTPTPPSGNILSRVAKTIGHQAAPVGKSVVKAAVPLAAGVVAGPGGAIAGNLAKPLIGKALDTGQTTPRSVINARKQEAPATPLPTSIPAAVAAATPQPTPAATPSATPAQVARYLPPSVGTDPTGGNLTREQYNSGEYYITGQGDQGYVYRHISQNPYDQRETSLHAPADYSLPPNMSPADLHPAVPTLTPSVTVDSPPTVDQTTFDPITGQWVTPGEGALAAEQQALSQGGAPQPISSQPNFSPPQFDPVTAQGGVSGIPEPTPNPNNQFTDVSGVVPQGSLPQGGYPQFAQETPTDFYNQAMQPPQSMDYMGGVGSPSDTLNYNLDLSGVDFNPSPSGFQLSPQAGIPYPEADLLSPYGIGLGSLGDVTSTDQFTAPSISGDVPTSGYIQGLLNQGLGSDLNTLINPSMNFGDPSLGGDPIVQSVGGNMQLSDPAAGAFTDLPTDFSSLGVPGAADVTAPIAGDPNFGAGIPGGSDFFNQIMTPPQVPASQFAQSQPSSQPAAYDPLSQGSTGQPGGVQSIPSTMFDPNTGQVSTFDPTTGSYQPAGWSNTGYGSGSPAGAGAAGPGGGGFGGYGGLYGSGAPDYGFSGGGIDTGGSGPGSNADPGAQGGVDPSSGSPGSSSIRTAVSEAGIPGVDTPKTGARYLANQANPYLPPPMPQQYISGYDWMHNPASSYGASTEARGGWFPIWSPGAGTNMVQPTYAGHAGMIVHG